MGIALQHGLVTGHVLGLIVEYIYIHIQDRSHTYIISAAWDLQISGVSMSDDALYQCQVGGSLQVEPIASDPVRLTVYVETTKPQILQGEEVEVAHGREEELQCMAEGRPRPEV